MKLKYFISLLAGVVILASFSTQAQHKTNPAIEEKVAELLKQMTLLQIGTK